MSAIDPNTIDVTQPPAVNPTTSGLRSVIAAIKALFTTAKAEVEGLQEAVAALEEASPSPGVPVGVQSFRGGNDIPFSFNPQKGNEQGAGPEFAAKDHKHGFVLELGASRWSNAYLVRKILPIPAVPPHTDNGDRTYDGRIILDGTLGVLLREHVPVSLEEEDPPDPSWQMAGCPSIYVGDTTTRDLIHNSVDLGPGARGARLYYNTDLEKLQVYVIDQGTGEGTWQDVGGGGGTGTRTDITLDPLEGQTYALATGASRNVTHPAVPLDSHDLEVKANGTVPGTNTSFSLGGETFLADRGSYTPRAVSWTLQTPGARTGKFSAANSDVQKGVMIEVEGNEYGCQVLDMTGDGTADNSVTLGTALTNGDVMNVTGLWSDWSLGTRLLNTDGPKYPTGRYYIAYSPTQSAVTVGHFSSLNANGNFASSSAETRLAFCGPKPEGYGTWGHDGISWVEMSRASQSDWQEKALRIDSSGFILRADGAPLTAGDMDTLFQDTSGVWTWFYPIVAMKSTDDTVSHYMYGLNLYYTEKDRNVLFSMGMYAGMYGGASEIKTQRNSETELMVFNGSGQNILQLRLRIETP